MKVETLKAAKRLLEEIIMDTTVVSLSESAANTIAEINAITGVRRKHRSGMRRHKPTLERWTGDETEALIGLVREWRERTGTVNDCATADWMHENGRFKHRTRNALVCRISLLEKEGKI